MPFLDSAKGWRYTATRLARRRHMGSKGGAIVVLIAAFLLIMPACAQTQLRGVVSDPEGAAISGAHVVIHWDSSGNGVGLASNVGVKQDLVLATDASGLFSANLPPGFYDVFVSAEAFSPDCRKVRTKSGIVAYKTKLKLSPIVAQELQGTRVSEQK
jgi:hypothetical protein